MPNVKRFNVFVEPVSAFVHPIHDDAVFFPPVDMRLAFTDEACAAIVDDALRAVRESREVVTLHEISALFGYGPLSERE